MVHDGRIKKSSRLKLGISYLKKHANEDEIPTKTIETICGVGIEVSDEDILEIIQKLFEEKEEEFKEKRYTVQTCLLPPIKLNNCLVKWKSVIRKQNPFADGGKINDLFDSKMLELLGPETEEDKKIKAELRQQ
jgi:glutaminyl-tRNA synthetase